MADAAVSLKSPPKVLPPHLRKIANAPSAKVEAQNVQEGLSDLGVNVAKPESATAPADSRSGSMIQATSQTHAKFVPTDKKVLDRAAPHVQSNEHTPRSSSSRGNGRGQVRGRGGRGNGIGGAGTRNSRWPTNAEQRPDPKRWTCDWDFEAANEEVSSIDTMWADCGTGQPAKRAAASGESYNLADFSGGWAPAPINWDARPPFKDPDRLPQIEKWLHDTTQDSQGCDVKITSSDLAEERAYEFAPRSWRPHRIEPGLSPSQWFTQLTQPKNPRPVHEGDLDAVVPWWQRYNSPDPKCVTLKLPAHPPKEDMDPNMNEVEWVAYNLDHGGKSHIERRREVEMAKKYAKAGRKNKAEEKARRLQERYGDVVVEGIRPNIKLYIRPATKEDMVAVRDIYNYHIRNSCVTAETTDRTESQMYQRLMDIRSAQLPFLVACERGAIMKARRKKGKPNWEDEGNIIMPDKVVGFAYADDWNDMHSMYRFTAELQVFVAYDKFMNGIGKCLLDKLVGLLDQTYMERRGFDVEGTDVEGTGALRRIDNLIVNYSYQDPNRLEWVGRWLEEWLDFQKVSNLPGIGEKNDESVSMATFLRKAGASIGRVNQPVAADQTAAVADPA
ncbi:hypothetical protein Tdes44962_MAKER04866 [Teratosphaeria destructans]|uniref:N-acetyltransferase domain-containing protein n=1 Tax=Teratosphaeria destructans TaxID=418781 RepID=A0A9W7SLG0_9PEZI|nr:hypothetical protein Tdes44962_MAKER04866 [Teratosphaeria destructans]